VPGSKGTAAAPPLVRPRAVDDWVYTTDSPRDAVDRIVRVLPAALRERLSPLPAAAKTKRAR
jgi:hypothetical protein